MGHLTVLILAVTVFQAYAIPPLISFQDGKLGVNFGGYHAGVGIGGLLANGTLGGLYAEAGTPTGQFATAGLGGNVGHNGQSTGGLFAGATAGGNYHASAGLSGLTNSGNSVGSGFATAQAGNRITSSYLGGLSGNKGPAVSYTGTKEVEVVPLKSSINTEVNVDSVNEVQPVDNTHVEITKSVIKEDTPPVLVKEVSKTWTPQYRHSTENSFNQFEDLFKSLFNFPIGTSPVDGYSKVYVEPQPQPQTVVEKEVIHTHYKPRRAHFRKTAFLGGYVGGNGEIVGPAPNAVNVEPIAEKRVGFEAHAAADADAHVNGGASNVYTKEVTVQRNPTFFRDIFDIPISTLKAVGNFLGNTASRTNISVQKSVQAEADPKHDPSLSSSSSAHISVETPSASSFIDDIFSIPINTLGAVNRFLENNVGRKSIQVVHEEGTPSRVRRVPHGRRRGNKKVIIEENPL